MQQSLASAASSEVKKCDGDAAMGKQTVFVVVVMSP